MNATRKIEKVTDIYAFSTSDQNLEKAIAKRLNIVGQIEKEMKTDDENESIKLLRVYSEMPPEARGIMDYMLVCLCGWTMNNIIENAEETKNIIPV